MSSTEQSDVQGEERADKAVEEMQEEPQRAVSLAYELATLQDALGAGRILADAIRAHTLDDEGEERRALSGLSGILSLVTCRLGAVGRVAAGFLDPQAILCPHNEALDIDGQEEPEVRLVAWSLRRRRRRLKDELERVRAQLAASKPPGKRERSGP